MRSSSSSRASRGPRVDLAAQRADQADPVLPRLEHARQAADGALVGRLVADGRRDLDDRLQRAPGGRQIADLLLLELRDAEQHLRALDEIGRAVGARVQQLGEIRPGLGLGEDLLERRLGLVVASLRLGEDLLGELARLLRPVEPAHRDAQRAPQQPQALLGRNLARLVASARPRTARPARPTRRPRRPGVRDRPSPRRRSAPARRRARTTGTPATSTPAAARRCAALPSEAAAARRPSDRPSVPRAPGRPAPRTSPAAAATSAPCDRAGSAPSPPCGSAGRSRGSRS